MKRHTPKFSALILAVCMLFTQIPTAAFAAVTMTSVADQQIQYGIGLGTGQYTIGEDGVVDVELCLEGTPYTRAEQPTDVVLLIDKSGSMQNDLDAMKSAAKSFIDALNFSTHRIGIVSYDSSAYSEPISSDKAALKTVVDNIPDNGGGTAIHIAIDEAVKLLVNKRQNAEGAIVLMTDGESDLPSALASAQAAKALGYSFYTVALCKAEDSPANLNLKKMATSEADHYSVFSSSRLDSVYSNIASKIGDINAKDVVITQSVNAQFDIVSGSTDNNIPQPTINGNSLTWKMTQLVRGDVTLNYQIKPKAGIPENTYNHAVGAIFYTDYAGNRVKLDIPMQEITVSYNGPVINSITPDKVDYKGGDEVVITGDYFRPGAIVTVDGTSVAYTYVSSKELKFTMPAHAISNRVMVMVKNPNGKYASRYIAVSASNAITSITPNTVQENTKQRVTITGAGFKGNYKTASVYVGGVKASIVSVSNETIICTMPKLPAGTYDVTVTNSDKTTSTLAGGYTSVGKTVVVNPCAITSITPNTVDEDVAQKVTITGTNFKGTYKTLKVKVGAVSATIFSVSETSIECRIPKLSADTYDVTVVNSDGTTATMAGGYTVIGKVVDPCTITSVSPATIEENTKQRVTITGTKFNGTYKTAHVFFGAVEATVVSVGETSILCTAPALPAGSYDVKVVNADGTSAVAANAYVVTAVPTEVCKITGLSVTSAEEKEMPRVTISGQKFNGSYKTAKVYFGTSEATIISISDTEIECRAPALSAGTYDVKVENGDGTTATLAGAYNVVAIVVPACTITGLSVTNISAGTRTNIVVSGTMFNGNYKTAEVYVGSYRATIASIYPTEVTIRTAAMPAGTYDVKIINADNTSAVLTNGLTVS